MTGLQAHSPRPAHVPTGDVVTTGAELRAWREGKGWSQAEAEQHLGVRQATVSEAERKADAPLSRKLREKVLGVPTPKPLKRRRRPKTAS